MCEGTQAVLPGMRSARWGRIINLSSVAAQKGGVVGPHYAASEAELIELTLIPVGPFGAIHEMAAVAAMLACNDYVTGQTINVNGGWYINAARRPAAAKSGKPYRLEARKREGATPRAFVFQTSGDSIP
jgi:NAD(P)-dependent dehydrogenase (short-subunit alcohol dehydrogenase family)